MDHHLVTRIGDAIETAPDYFDLQAEEVYEIYMYIFHFNWFLFVCVFAIDDYLVFGFCLFKAPKMSATYADMHAV